MINKELLSEVFNQEVRFIKYVANNTYEIHFEKPTRLKYIIINMYELAHKCKEWAYKEGFIIDTGFHKYYINQFKANCYGWVSSNINIKQHFNECTEQEAIFKACQWILDNKED